MSSLLFLVFAPLFVLAVAPTLGWSHPIFRLFEMRSPAADQATEGKSGSRPKARGAPREQRRREPPRRS